MKKLNLVGQKFGRLTVQCGAPNRGRTTRWECICECGTTIIVDANNLRANHTKSCGCLDRELTSIRSTTHGATVGGNIGRTYKTWESLKWRCASKKPKQFKSYGSKGITVCERWLSFENFLADMGERPPGLTIDRINNDKGYEPGNCKWATYSEQNKNRRPFKINRSKL